MATLTGIFTGSGDQSAWVKYSKGQSVKFGITGEWPRARIHAEVSTDGVTWTPAWTDQGLAGSSFVQDQGGPRLVSGVASCQPPGPGGWFRLRAEEFTSGWCDWTVSND